MLLALEKVNLIKDAGFEQGSSVWGYRTIPATVDSVYLNSHDSDSAVVGSYCASIDTRKKPFSSSLSVTGEVSEVLTNHKKLEDLDTIEFRHMFVSRDTLKNLMGNYAMTLRFINPANQRRIIVLYGWLNPNAIPPTDDIYTKYFSDTAYKQGEWYMCIRDLKKDIAETKLLPLDLELDSLVLFASGYDDNGWRGQKAFFDAIRLTGWADYDIGLTRISGDLTHPRAVVWNNGREDQTDVKVIATIEGSTPYADTVIVPSLASDDSTEVSFKDYTGGSGGGTYTLTVVTGGLAGMSPDECDEDDILTREYSGIGETPSTSVLQLDITRNTPSSFLVSYSIPNSEQGMISLYDPSGRRIESHTVIGSGRLTMNSALSSGVYFIKLETSQTTITRKAVVLR